MVQLPIGFFMPLPLPVMIPFMMWQSAAIAAGFGTYFQFAKRKVSAMSNEEFNRADPHKLVEDLYDDIIQAMPSSFTKIDSMTPIILDSMLKMLTNAAEWFAGILGGTGPADALHHLQGLPGHLGHAGFGETLDTPPGQDEPVGLPLINVSANTVSGWNNTKLFHIFKNQLHLYDASSQTRITTFYNLRINAESKKEETILLDIPDSEIKHALQQIPRKPQFLPRLVYAAIFKKTTVKQLFFYLAQIMGGINSKLKTAPSGTPRTVLNQQKTEVQQLIIFLNKILGI